jgi:hypothetical protein
VEKKVCNLCGEKKKVSKFYVAKYEGKEYFLNRCKWCSNFLTSVRFLDWEQGKIKRLDSPKEQRIAEYIGRKKRVKKALRG